MAGSPENPAVTGRTRKLHTEKPLTPRGFEHRIMMGKKTSSTTVDKRMLMKAAHKASGQCQVFETNLLQYKIQYFLSFLNKMNGIELWLTVVWMNMLVFKTGNHNLCFLLDLSKHVLTLSICHFFANELDLSPWLAYPRFQTWRIIIIYQSRTIISLEDIRKHFILSHVVIRIM